MTASFSSAMKEKRLCSLLHLSMIKKNSQGLSGKANICPGRNQYHPCPETSEERILVEKRSTKDFYNHPFPSAQPKEC